PQLRQAIALPLQPLRLLFAVELEAQIDFVETSHRYRLPVHSPESPRDSSIGGGRLSVVMLAAKGRSRAPRAIRATPAATSQRAPLRWPRMPTPKPISIRAM